MSNLEEQNFKDEINSRFSVNKAEEEVVFLSNFVKLSGFINSSGFEILYLFK